jgi:hypothetical protein
MSNLLLNALAGYVSFDVIKVRRDCLVNFVFLLRSGPLRVGGSFSEEVRFSFYEASVLVSGPTQPPVQWEPVATSSAESGRSIHN